jgi:hypothetical protein
MRRRWVGAAALLTGLAAVVDAAAGGAGAAVRPGRSPAARSVVPVVRPSRPPLARGLATTLDPYKGLGTWIDVYDWSRSFSRGGPLVGPADVDKMAASGVQTLFVQTGKWDSPADVVDPDLLTPIVRRAHQRGLRVVAWYLPTLVDPGTDLRRIVAAAGVGADGIAVDIEARDVPDAAERSRRLVFLSAAIRQALPGRKIGGIVLPPVFLDSISPGFWPRFPWKQIRQSYDVWLPMAYWTERKRSSGWRDGYRYTAYNVASLRRHLGIPGAPIHFIGGLGATTVPADIGGMNRGAAENGLLGASLYDWRTTRDALWPYLRPLRTR